MRVAAGATKEGYIVVFAEISTLAERQSCRMSFPRTTREQPVQDGEEKAAQVGQP